MYVGYDSTRYWSAVVPSDATVIPETNLLYVGVAGDLNVTCNGVDILFKAAPVGYHLIRCTKVKATNTTATNILAAN